MPKRIGVWNVPEELDAAPKKALLDMLEGWWEHLLENGEEEANPEYVSQVFSVFQAAGAAMNQGMTPRTYVQRHVLPLFAKGKTVRDRRRINIAPPRGVGERRTLEKPH